MILTREITAAPQPLRRSLYLLQHAVDAVAQAQLAIHRLDMDVRGARLDGAGDEQIDQPYDRRLAGAVPELLDVLAGALVGPPARRLGDLRDRRFTLRVKPLESSVDISGIGHVAQHRLSSGEPHRRRRLVIERVRHGDGDAIGTLGDGNDAGLLKEFSAEHAL